MTTREYLLAAASACALAIGMPGVAFAQEAFPPEQDGIQDIVVTAQKRAQSLQDVPISIAAFSDSVLTSANISEVADLGQIATNFSATKATQSANLRLTIRGIGAPGNTATEPSVAAFLDGIYIPRPGSIVGSFLDIESVEVLRGPQGTLFGRNASVGALSLHSATPKNAFSAHVTGEIGNADRYKLQGHINVPITDNVAVRVAAQGQRFGGYWTNRLDGSQFGGMDETAARVSFKGEFGALTWIVRGDYSHSEGDGFPNIDFDPTSISSAQLEAFQTALGGTLPDTKLFDRKANQHTTADLEDRQWGVSSDMSLDVNGYTIRLVNSYRDWKNDQLEGDLFFTPLPLLSRVAHYRSKSQNHELQFISPQNELLDGRLDFVGGLYYFQEDFQIGEQVHLSSQFCNVLVPAGSQPACNDLLDKGQGVGATDQDFAQTVKSFAVYGQATFKLADPLDLTLGGRWSKDEKDGHYIVTVNNPFATALRATENTPLSLDDDRFTWRASLNYKPTKDLLFFANYSTGYKSGGFNSGGGIPALGQRRIFARETVDNYELGAKTSWLDNALRINATLYRMDIKGFQDRSFDGVSFVVKNAGSLRHQGLELDMVLAPTSRFSVNASLAYLDSKFTSYPNASGLPGLEGTQELKGARATFAPEFTTSFGAEWRGDIGSTGMEWVLNGNMSLISDVNVGGVTDNNPQTIQDGYALLGARLTLNGPDDRWSLAFFGNNLTGKGYCINRFYQTFDGAFGLRNGVFPGSSGVRCQEGDPRSYGVSGTVRF